MKKRRAKKTPWAQQGISRSTYFRRRLIMPVDKGSSEATLLKVIFLLKGHSPSQAKKILYSAMELTK